jgi:hypothetical protein
MDEGAPKSVAKTGEEPTKIIEIGGKKFEVGPFFGLKNWDDMSEMIADVNNTLKEGEKPFRVLTNEEYNEIVKTCRVICGEKGLSNIEKKTKFDEFVTSLGFGPSNYYWSSTVNKCTFNDYDDVYDWHSDFEWIINCNGGLGGVTKDDKLLVQCFREV